MQQTESNDADTDDAWTLVNIEQQYSDGTVHYEIAGRDATLFIEAIEVTADRVEHNDHPHGMDVGDTFYHAGVFDTSIGSHPSIEDSTSDHRTRKSAVASLLENAVNLDRLLREHRETDAYQRAIEVEERAPEFSPGAGDGRLPEYHVRRQQDRVYGGRATVEEAVAVLEDAAEGFPNA